ncbi:MAG: ABC transporter permease [Caldilineaceae bacterium SB0662_bin_9]|uniref:ABC transporter permease n=1 Tax=Caldilineaceae bacterium SB0662_bin_9 TaxID=2605258 RepID=A0A6B1DSC7_9CHLR|nr:ABC transporter permease [Caldilineaceae bacterium]MYD89715.1 ABC transporter permease [Caldilineaceae bacterium SB0662_bin_9]
MRTYILKRVIQAIPLLFLISFIVFLSIQATGDPLAAYTVDASLTSDDIARLKAKYGLDQPVPIQYLNWLKNMATGNWGTSYFTREDVVDMILERLPNTLILFAVSYALILGVALILGILTAIRQYSLFDYSVTALSFLGIATPSFWLGLMLIYLFAVRLKAWGLPSLPVGGMYDLSEGKTLVEVSRHVILPAITLSVVVCARYVRYIRSSILEQLQLDYVRTATAKGLRSRAVLFRHVMKNVLLPLVTLVGLDLPNFLSGTIVIESIFAWPGVGRLFWSAAERTDIPVLMAVMLFVAVMTVVFNLIADIFYAVVDPRISYS